MNVLPKMAVPSYKVTVPSLNKEVTYRPYLVKEEKVLYIALESADVNQIQQAVIDTIDECVDLPVKAKTLPTYDIEYLYLMLRAKSVGEVIKLNRVCDECGHVNELEVNLEQVSIEKPERDETIKLTEDFIIKMKEMNIAEVPEQLQDERDHVIASVYKSIDKIYYKDETFYASDFKNEELQEFVYSLTTGQFQKLVDYVLASPYIKHNQLHKCHKCGHESDVEFQGLLDFFI